MSTKTMTVGQVEPITMEWIHDAMPSGPPPGLFAVALTIANPAIAELDPPNKVLLVQPNTYTLSIKAKAVGTTSIGLMAVTTDMAGSPKPAIILDPVELTVEEGPETYYGSLKIGQPK